MAEKSIFNKFFSMSINDPDYSGWASGQVRAAEKRGPIIRLVTMNRLLIQQGYQTMIKSSYIGMKKDRGTN